MLNMLCNSKTYKASIGAIGGSPADDNLGIKVFVNFEKVDECCIISILLAKRQSGKYKRYHKGRKEGLLQFLNPEWLDMSSPRNENKQLTKSRSCSNQLPGTCTFKCYWTCLPQC